VESERARLERFAKQWSAFEGFDNILMRHRTRQVLNFSRGKNALEVGCADGFSTLQIIKKFEKVVVVEASSYYLEATKRLVGDSVDFHLSLFEEFKTDEKFDTIFLLALLEHVRDPKQVLRLAGTMLAARGRILITIPNAGSIHRRLGVRLGLLKSCEDFSEGDRQVGHRRVYSLGVLKDELKEAGLRVELIRGIGLKFLSNAQMGEFPCRITEKLLELDNEVPVEFCGNLFAVCGI